MIREILRNTPKRELIGSVIGMVALTAALYALTVIASVMVSVP